MLPKQFRLPSYLIPEVMKKGRIIQNDLFFLRFVQGSTLRRCKVEPYKNNQFAFLVSQKIDKRATVRNKVKRRLSEAVRSLMSEIKPGLAVVIMAKKEILKADYKKIKQQIEEALIALFSHPEAKPKDLAKRLR